MHAVSLIHLMMILVASLRLLFLLFSLVFIFVAMLCRFFSSSSFLSLSLSLSLSLAFGVAHADDRLARFHLAMLQEQSAADGRRSGTADAASDTVLTIRPVERRQELNADEYMAEYARAQMPVVLEGALAPERLSWDRLLELCGTQLVRPRQRLPGSRTWAGLVDSAKELSLAAYMHALQVAQANDTVVFDWSLPQNCPAALPALGGLPQFITLDLLRALGDDLHPHRAGDALVLNHFVTRWPSLFAAPPKTYSDMHVDAFSSNFYMLQLAGRKRWTLVHR